MCNSIVRKCNSIVLATMALFYSNAVERASLARQTTAPPERMLWAWERPEDLRFVDTKTTGVAYLAATIKVKKSKVTCINRHQPLQVPPGTYMMPVVRIESDGTLSESNNQSIISEIVSLLPRYLNPRVRGFQFDFDARKSERVWYKKFLIQVREVLPQEIYLSMTSLASWCLGDDWISGSSLPVDEVVPMFFEMGADNKPVAVLLNQGNTFGHSYQALGISDKDPAMNRLIGKSVAGILKPVPRVYMFSRTPWNQQKAENLIQEVNNWR
ncbi:MAG: DUF3142 domain-containing protein [Cyanobacteria bacterium SZAS-4]|nr:DUF3142 domain-containing protein [Cyanobacteria bacterium SZAS-4]